jgi:NADH-quinone oxidoreductase subunit C
MDILEDKFKIIEIKNINKDKSLKYIQQKNIRECLNFLKNSSEYSIDLLMSITANDLGSQIELIYDLYSSKLNNNEYIAIKIDSGNPIVQSVSSVFKSAVFDEQEIFDLFGVYFDGYENMKRLLLPESSLGNTLLKNSSFKDERLSWNE